MGTGINLYYALPKDLRWLDNPYQIGGRDADVAQIAYSLQSIVKDLYPLNKVPPQIESELNTLTCILEQADYQIDYFIGVVSKEVKDARDKG